MVPRSEKAARAWFLIAQLERDSGNKAKAIAALDQLIENYPAHSCVPDAYLLQGEIYFSFVNGKLYCRKCIHLTGKAVNTKYEVKEGRYKLEYSLTKEQKRASLFVLNNVKNNASCAINAVCGAGKTEIIYETIQYCINNHKRVGIAIPRKDVVIELKERITKDFNVSVVGVYGGNSECVEGDIIVFTTHQAFRYIGYFDVLIIDEVDAFPYKDNKTLQNIISNCSKTFVYLSATMPKYIEKDISVCKYYLNKRYHGFKIPVPRCKTCFFLFWKTRSIQKKYKDKVRKSQLTKLPLTPCFLTFSELQ